tara:strand:+ start:2028 stop:2267 length:240 start_codon:yes stop_codon:yes gene_type:complete
MFMRNVASISALLCVLSLNACGTCDVEEDTADTDVEETTEGTTEGTTEDPTEETEESEDTGGDTAATDPEDTAVDTDTE